MLLVLYIFMGKLLLVYFSLEELWIVFDDYVFCMYVGLNVVCMIEEFELWFVEICV